MTPAINREARVNYDRHRAELARAGIRRAMLTLPPDQTEACDFCRLYLDQPLAFAQLPAVFPPDECECRPVCRVRLVPLESAEAAMERATANAEANARHTANNELRRQIRRLVGEMEAQRRTHGLILGPPERDECPACRAVTGRRIPLAEALNFPPPACACRPYCRCTLATDSWLCA